MTGHLFIEKFSFYWNIFFLLEIIHRNYNIYCRLYNYCKVNFYYVSFWGDSVSEDDLLSSVSLAVESFLGVEVAEREEVEDDS